MSSYSPSQRPQVNLSLTLSSPLVEETSIKPEERGVKLIQLLLTCANHASSGNLHHADACLQQISQLASVSGDSMQRLASRFATALALRLIKRWPGLYKVIHQNGLTVADRHRARSIFNKRFPYMAFAYSILTRCLAQSVSNEPIIHILDLGSGDPQLWIQLIQNLVKSGAERPHHLKISSVHDDRTTLDNLESALSKEAEKYGIPFEFNPINVSLTKLSLDMVKVRPGEAFLVTSMLSLHNLLAEDEIGVNFGPRKKNGVSDCKKLGEFLKMVGSMSPKVVLLVEQESDHNLTRLVDRFVEGLHFYSALFDSIDATFKGDSSSEERFVLEEMFGKEIENIVGCEGVEREERHERLGKWGIRLGQAGFRPVRLWYDAVEETKRIVDSYGMVGYKIVNQKGSLMICWHDRPIYAVSSWTSLISY